MASTKKDATPGRRKKTDQQYFDVGKVGRKTGITLKDTGIRDEHGLEPVSGIFSSPDQHEEETSQGMDVQESSAPDVTATLTSRRKPRLPPPRQSTPRHTNIGSPKRMSSVKPDARAHEASEERESPGSSAQPAPNRRLDFGATTRNRKSISVLDTESPFKPRKVLRRSTGPARSDPFAVIPSDDEGRTSLGQTNGDYEDVEQSIEGDDGPEDAGSYSGTPGDDRVGMEETQPVVPSEERQKPRRGRPRKSDQSLNNSQIQHITPAAAMVSGQKRDRTELEDEEETVDHSRTSVAPGSNPSSSNKRRSLGAGQVIVHRDEEEIPMDPSLLAHGDEYTVNIEAPPLEETQLDAQTQLDSQLQIQPGQDTQPPQDEEPAKKSRGRPRGKRGKNVQVRQEESAQTQVNGSQTRPSDEPSRIYRGGSTVPISNVNLRATTPFEDAGRQTSKYGRNLIQPLKFWENEARIWRAGEIEGIVRAEHVEKPKPKGKKRRKRGGRSGRLDDIDEESETESTIPDEWEEEVGVITGNVASWDPNTKAGDPGNPKEEDIAFASSSIITREVAGSEFKYAKIMTLPFFGAGVVELPPDGYKRAKNSRKMQMVFFVHEGKVMVEVGATGMEVNQFALSKGGVWVVPRGNNYAITNESRTKSAKIFFAQGAVVEGAE